MRRLVIPVSLALTAVGTRVAVAWHAPLSQDEVFSARIIGDPSLPDAVRRIVRTESTPPLWYALGWIVHHVGVPIVDVRALSVASGAGLAVVVYTLARTVVPPAQATVAGALVAVGFEPVLHGGELRAYELLALLAATFCALLVLEVRRPRRRLEVAIAATVWAGLLTHYFFAYSAIAALAWVWLEPTVRPLRRRLTAAFAAGAAFASPWLPAFVAQYHHDHFWWIGPFDARVVLTTPLRLFTPYAGRHLALGIAVLGLLAGGAAALSRRSPEARLVAALGVAPIAFAAATWAAGLRTFTVRNLLEAAPFVAVTFVAAVAALPRRAAVPAAATTLALVAGVSLLRVTLPRPPYQRLAQDLVAEGWRPSDPIAIFGNFFMFRAPLEWYLPHGPLFDVSHPTRHPCETMFVIGPRLRVRVPRPDVRAARLASAFAVVRLRGGETLHLRRATLLDAEAARADCVRASRDPRLRPLA